MQNTDALTRLALDLSWSWNRSADEVWRKLDPEPWELAFDVEAHLGRLNPAAVQVELYAEPQPATPAFRKEMQRRVVIVP